MKRPWTIALGSVVLVLAAAALARAEDEVTYYDRDAKKEAKVVGTIQSEDPGKIVVKTGVGAPREIPVGDVLSVKYQVPVAIKLDLDYAINSERATETETTDAARQKALADAISKYQALLPQATEDRVKRLIAFKLLKLRATQAEQQHADLGPIIDELAKYRQANADSWEVVPASLLLAQLEQENKDLDGALKTYEALAKTPGVSKQTAQEAQVKAVQVLIAAGKAADAQQRIDTVLAGAAPDDPQTIRLQIMRAACAAAGGQLPQATKDLEGLINKVTDPDLKALAYNTLGDCYQKAGRPEDARWQYLWVDVIYHQDPVQHARALYNLYRVLKDMKDEARASQVKDVLEKDKEFAGTEYQRLIAAEK